MSRCTINGVSQLGDSHRQRSNLPVAYQPAGPVEVRPKQDSTTGLVSPLASPPKVSHTHTHTHTPVQQKEISADLISHHSTTVMGIIPTFMEEGDFSQG